MKKPILFLLLFLWVQSRLLGQSSDKLNIYQLLSSKLVTPTAGPFDLGHLEDAFDGNEYKVVRSDPAHNPMQITLTFKTKISFTQSRIFSQTPAQWTLETADTQTDLDKHTGSYKIWLRDSPIGQNAFYSHEFMTQAFIIKLTLRRTNPDYYPHLGEWELYGSYKPLIPVSVEVKPDKINLDLNTAKRLEAYATTADNITYLLSESDLSWESSNSDIVSVSSTGVIRSLANGKSSIRATIVGPTKITGFGEVTVNPEGITCK